ncbi:MAG TPA: hypothetical protein VF204_18790, partial [Streptosporangiaceae bacterium]
MQIRHHGSRPRGGRPGPPRRPAGRLRVVQAGPHAQREHIPLGRPQCGQPRGETPQRGTVVDPAGQLVG